MPLFPHHKRRHSWPYCSPGVHSRLHLADLRVSKLRSTAKTPQLLSFQAPTQDLYYGEEEEEDDDAASAGIVRSKTAKSHRLFWSHPSKSQPQKEAFVSSVTEASEVPTAALRRAIRPPLDKARSLFVLPTTTAAAAAAAAVGGNFVISCWVPASATSSVPARPVAVVDCTRGATVGGNAVVAHNRWLPEERNHRRCHSEQPRSWREPSASLFTLLEE